ncbi:hypothetical protein F5X97DRAFT_230832 [Nemania serpens]|nr:hypothetical protein F5X97DRAFT_230832 [Nemania serpens]
MLLLQHNANLRSRNLSSTASDNKNVDIPEESVVEERSEFEEAVESLLQFSQDNTPAAANRFLGRWP